MSPRTPHPGVVDRSRSAEPTPPRVPLASQGTKEEAVFPLARYRVGRGGRRQSRARPRLDYRAPPRDQRRGRGRVRARRPSPRTPRFPPGMNTPTTRAKLGRTALRTPRTLRGQRARRTDTMPRPCKNRSGWEYASPHGTRRCDSLRPPRRWHRRRRPAPLAGKAASASSRKRRSRRRRPRPADSARTDSRLHHGRPRKGSAFVSEMNSLPTQIEVGDAVTVGDIVYRPSLEGACPRARTVMDL